MSWHDIFGILGILGFTVFTVGLVGWCSNLWNSKGENFSALMPIGLLMMAFGFGGAVA